MNNFITTDFLNLRNQPLIAKGNVIAVMPPDTVVESINGEMSGWLKVKVMLGKTWTEGFASRKYLQATTLALPEEQPAAAIPLVHYPPGDRKVSRNQTGTWAYHLNEPGLLKVALDQVQGETEKCASIHNVVEYLDVEHSARYAPKLPSTYCNIYAYDVAYCLGAYLPRVWWTAEAIVQLQQGKILVPKYDQNITEYTANRICNWFDQYGVSFGWQRLFDLTALQNEVNKGRLGIIVAQRINMSNPGHIVAVVPENDQHKAKWNGSMVISPLQSQAGARNKKYFSGLNWWEDSGKFKKFGFWVWG
jgi:hypothetical protein